MNRNGGNQSVAKIVKQVLNSQEERKWKLTTFSSGIDSTMQSIDLTSISNGTTSSSRVGSQIRLKKLNLNWVSAIGDSTNLIRVAIVFWKPNDAVDVPQQSEVFQTSGCLAPYLKLNPSRFKLVKDFLLIFDTYHPVQKGEIEIKLDQLVSYVPGLDTGMNHLYLLVFSDSGGVPNPTFEFNSSVEFVDD